MNLRYILLCLNYISTSAYIIDIAKTSVWLSGASYCGKENYKNMELAEPIQNFIVHDILYDAKTDLQGYTGTLINTDKSLDIYIVFRGSSSTLNWIDDFEFIKTSYLTYPECNCSVHTGFYKAVLNLKNDTILSINKLTTIYKNYNNIIVTGHSLGAAIAQLISMELNCINIDNKLYNFGQPRIGDKQYSEFVNRNIQDMFRFTHNKDIVPHVPPIEMGYTHSCGEIFENINGLLRECSKIICEDISCADQYKLKETDTDDHSIYLGHYVNCGNSTKKSSQSF
jgi:hypothetical protein